MTFFDKGNPYGIMVFTDMLERSGMFQDLFANGDRPDPTTDNAYLKGRESMMKEMLDIMGITGQDIDNQQTKRVAEALSTVLPIEIDEQTIAEGEDE